MASKGLLGYDLGTGFNRAMNPVRRLLGADVAPLPPGVREVDYGYMIDTAMGGFGGADPGRRGVNRPGKPKRVRKMQDRVPQARGREDDAPRPQPGEKRLARQMAGDMPPMPRGFGLDTKIKMMRR